MTDLPEVPIVDSHVHLWDPRRFRMPWLDDNAHLRQRFELREFSEHTQGLPIEAIVYLQVDVTPAYGLLEATWAAEQVERAGRVAGIGAQGWCGARAAWVGQAAGEGAARWAARARLSTMVTAAAISAALRAIRVICQPAMPPVREPLMDHAPVAEDYTAAPYLQRDRSTCRWIGVGCLRESSTGSAEIPAYGGTT